MVVVLQDYPSAEISKPIYKMGEKLRLIAQYDDVFCNLALKNSYKETISPKKEKKVSLQYREVVRLKGQ